ADDPTPRRSGDVQPARPAATRSARAANPLPDLGIAIDENVRAAETRSAETRAAETRAAEQRSAQPAATPPAPADARDTLRTADSTAANTAEFAVQAAAFSERRPAETIAAEMRAKGLDARIVQVPGSPYFGVRYGMFATSREAAAASLRVRDAGFATLIVNDVRLERRP
ncbi:MAG: SPOR domain-containing protein, partial [Longimicrobiales bacterium]